MKNKIISLLLVMVLIILYIEPISIGLYNYKNENNNVNIDSLKLLNLFDNNGETLQIQRTESFGFILFSPEQSMRTYLINTDGEIVHTWNTGYLPGKSAYLLEDGNLLRTTFLGAHPRFVAGGMGGGVQKIGWDGEVLWNYEYSSIDYLSHHDVEPLPNGNILMIAWEYKSTSEAIAAGRDPNELNIYGLWPDHIIEVEPTGSNGGNIVWEWHAWDHIIQDFDPTKDNYGVVEDHPELIDINYVGLISHSDWTHINSIDYNENLDQIILGVNHFEEIWIIEHGGNSDLLYRWGNPQTYKIGDENDQKFFEVHDAQWIEEGHPGAGNILIFNNGWNRPSGQYSTVEEIDPPEQGSGYEYTAGETYGPSEQEWIYIAENPTDFYTLTRGGAQRLRDGNTIICDSDDGFFFEVDYQQDVVWSYINTYPSGINNHVFKIRKYEPDYPGIVELFQNNNKPNDPVTPSGPTSGVDYTTYEYSTNTIDPDNNQIRYGWDWDGDDSIDEWTDYYSSGNTINISHSWHNTGSYEVKVKAQDEHGLQSNFSTPLTVIIHQNTAPTTPNNPQGPTSGIHGNIYSYTSNSTDPDGHDLYYKFDWDDGTDSGWIGHFGSGEQVSAYKIWDQVGIYDIRVKAKDTSGDESDWSLSTTVSIGNNPPDTPLAPIGPSSGKAGKTLSYSTTSSDPEGDIIQYQYSWGDGNESDWDDETNSHIWNTPGTYEIKVKARDSWDESNWSQITLIEILESTVLANPNGPYYGVEGIPVQFNGSAINGEIPYIWNWDFGDEVGIATEQNPEYTYYNSGEYIVNLTVIDSNDDFDTESTFAYIIENDEILANAGGPYSGKTGIEIQLYGNAIGGTEPYTWLWDFGDGETSDEQNPSHIFTGQGEYNITLTVTDIRWKSDTDITIATVLQATSDLECIGSLNWIDVSPLETVTNTFIVENIGDPGTLLDWEITEFPSWGLWTFTPNNGNDLSPEDGSKIVSVSVVVPDEKNVNLTGNIKIVNLDNANDYCIIQVTLVTPKINSFSLYNIIITFLENHPYLFPLFNLILKLIY